MRILIGIFFKSTLEENRKVIDYGTIAKKLGIDKNTFVVCF